MPLDHYIPQVHLRKFIAPELGGKIYAIRKSDLKRFPCHSRSVCRIENGSTNFYLEDTRVLEDFLRIVEPKYDVALAKLRAGEVDSDTVVTIAGFAALVGSCTPAAMRINRVPLHRQLEADVALLERQGKLPPPPPELGGGSLSELLAAGVVKFDIDPKFSQFLGIRTVAKRALVFGNSRWDILHCAGSAGAFFTSDYPVALEATWAHSPPNWIIPLAPDLAVRISPDPTLLQDEPDASLSKFQYKRHSVTSSEVRDLNRLIVRCAEDLVFFRDDADWVGPFVAENRHYRVEDVTTVMPTARGFVQISRRKIVPHVFPPDAGGPEK